MDSLLESDRFVLDNPPEMDVEIGRALYRRHDGLEFPDAVLVAYMRRLGVDDRYSFDGKFDKFDDRTRPNAAVDPFG